ncbi:MAG: TOBE domain-containing protein [Candidatus Caldarchaeum sp.]
MSVIEFNGRKIRIQPSHLEFLDGIRRNSSISSACRHAGISYRTGLNWLKEIERECGGKPVKSVKGGKHGGKTELTEIGLKLLESYYTVMSSTRPGFIKSLIESKLSARNLLSGYVEEIVESDLISMVRVDLDSHQEIKSVVTTESLKRLNVKLGDRIYIIIKATEAMLLKP